MKSVIVKKWIEPYVLLETAKKYFDMQDFTFDGFSKNNTKEEFLKQLSKKEQTSFGLYMKNVNKFYLFSSSKSMDIEQELLQKALKLTENDYEITSDTDKPINLVDLGKAEAGVIIAD